MGGTASQTADVRVVAATNRSLEDEVRTGRSREDLFFTTVTGGLAHPEKKVAIQQVSLVAEERTLKGSYVGSCVPVRDVARYVR